MPITLECEHCEQPFEAYPYEADSRRWCSQDCRYGYVKLFGEPVMKRCQKCGVELAVESFPVTGYGNRRSICSDCYSSEKSERYQRLKKRRMENGYQKVEEKQCSRCGETLPIEQFSKDAASRDGHTDRCKDCQSEYYKEWRQENRERLLEYHYKWREENDRGRYYIRRRQRQHDLPGAHTVKDIYRQWHRQDGHCFWCGERCGTQPHHHDEYHVDHITPVSRTEANPTEWPRNMVIACKKCNVRRHNKLPIEYKHHRLKYSGASKTYFYGTSLA